MNENIFKIKQRFNLVGNSSNFERALEKALRVANTNISILVTGESGTGKDVIPKIIHENSSRKHGKYIAVNCGAIPEGTIDSELFGHEKGAFTGAVNKRSGYFEAANNGTIFLDEIGDLPLQTQVRLLRVLENGEFIKVGSSIVEKTNVRVIAATNLNLVEAVEKSKFREDLYYRINTVEINMPPLRFRKEDIHIFFRKFASDFSSKNKIPQVKLNNDAVEMIENHNWPGNIRQLKNFAEKLSIVEEKRLLNSADLKSYLRPNSPQTSLVKSSKTDNTQYSDREILYKILFDLKNDLNDLKKITLDLIEDKNSNIDFQNDNAERIERIYNKNRHLNLSEFENIKKEKTIEPEFIEENLSLQDNEYEMIQKALEKNNGKRKFAAQELGISERTLYRKLKQYDL
ncbi:MAG: sigma-54 dependent transcriptional regulator [Bacteroidota bacterium]|nr:sigma-54 dependent transcriptional regulator [Bacteroidota bacterium]